MSVELGFDYLRDHLALTPEQTVLPGGAGEFNGFCVVDEADSVLIDEARTPLIISKQVASPATKYQTAFKLAEALKPDIHYTVDLKNKACTLQHNTYVTHQLDRMIYTIITTNTKNTSFFLFSIHTHEGWC